MFNSNSEVNAINPALAQKLGLQIRKTNVRAQKINDSALKTFEIVIAVFQVEDKVARLRFFQKTFLLADNKFEVILAMLFLKFSNADMFLMKEYSYGNLTPPTKPYQLPSELNLSI